MSSGSAPGDGTFGVVIAAAGGGTRFGTVDGRKKQFLELRGRPILHYSLDVFSSQSEVQGVVVVAPVDDVPFVLESMKEWRENASAADLPKVAVVPGGARRQDSVRIGLSTFWETYEFALVHDAARPLLREEDVAAVIAGVRDAGAAVIGFPATDSIKWEQGGTVEKSLDRSRIWQVQTPQGARCDWLRKAYDELPEGEERTDEVGLLSDIGIRVRLVEGTHENLKVTRPGDEALAEFLLERRE